MMEWTRDLPFSRGYLAIVAGVAALVGALAFFGQSSTLALAAAVLGLYVLHLFSNWQLASNQRKQWQTLREVERMLTDLGGPRETESGGPTTASDGEELTAVGEEREDVPPSSGEAEAEEPSEPAAATGTLEEPGEEDESVLVPRRYRLGTVAVVRQVLTPEEVARVLAVQERHPDRQFGEIAVELDVLTESQLEDLLELQERGLYHPERIERARRELREYRRRKAEELGTGR